MGVLSSSVRTASRSSGSIDNHSSFCSIHERQSLLWQYHAKSSANLYSLIETAKANGIEPYAYLKMIFTVGESRMANAGK